MRLKIMSVFWFSFVFSSIVSQQELGTYFFQDLHQSAALNPSFDAGNKIVIGFPSGFSTFHQRGYSVNSLLKGQIFDGINSKENQLLTGIDLSVLKVSVKSGAFRYNFAHNYKFYSDLQLSNPLIQILKNGNASIIGGSVSFSPNLNMNLYSESLIGVSYSGPISWGVNFKILNGIQNISTGESDFKFSVNDDIYQLELKSSFLLNSSFPIDFSNLKEIKLSTLQIFPNNYGIAFDLGASYNFGRYSFAVSALDIGFLRWKEQVHNYKSEGTIAFEGIELSDLFDKEINVLDTLNSLINFESSKLSYAKFVPIKLYANVNYDLTQNVKLGALLYTHRSYGKTNGAFALNIQRSWQSRHSIAAQYSVIGSNYLNVGFSGYTTLGPVQIYGIFDNVLGFINILGSENVSARIGINLVFDRKNKTASIKA